MKIKLESRSKKILAGVAALLVLGVALSAVSDPQVDEQVEQADVVPVEADDGIGDGAEPLPVVEEPVEEPVVVEPVIEEPVVEEPVVEEPVVEEPVEELASAELMRLFAPAVMANAGYPMSTVGEYVWGTVDAEAFDSVGYPVCESVELIGFELTALSIYDETATMVSAYDIDTGPGSVGAMLGAFVGAYCPDSM